MRMAITDTTDVTDGSEPEPDSRPTLRLVEPSRPTTQDWLCRRLNVAIFDLGLSEVLGRSWVASDAEGVHFANLRTKQADHLANLFEDLAHRLTGTSPGHQSRPSVEAGQSEPGQGSRYQQLTLF
jgi:hypothetical protein